MFLRHWFAVEIFIHYYKIVFEFSTTTISYSLRLNLSDFFFSFHTYYEKCISEGEREMILIALVKY